MGCGNSAFDEFMNRPDMKENMRQFQSMQFSRSEIRKLFEIFSAVDADNSGSIALAELLAHIHLDRTPFTEKIFSIFDDDHSGEIDFREFVMSLWNYCTLTKNTLDMFAFDLYDKDGSGELNPSEITKMVQDIYGKNEAKTNFHAKSIINELHALELNNKVLNLDQFTTFVKNHAALLFPAFQMQSALRRNILGTSFWESHANKRIRFTNGKYVSVGQFLVAHSAGDKSSPLTQLHAGDKQVYHMGDEVHELVEAAGSRASRRKSVARNQNRQSFADPNAVPSELVLGIANPTSLTESAKMRVTSALVGMGLVKQRRGSVAPHPGGGSMENSPYVSSANITNIASGSVPPSSKQDGVILNNNGANIASPFVSPRDREVGGRSQQPGNRRHSREDATAGTTLNNPHLTLGAVGKIEKASAIDAWQQQPANPAVRRKSVAQGGSAHGSGHDLKILASAEPTADPHGDARRRRGSFGGGGTAFTTPTGPGGNSDHTTATAASAAASDAKRRRGSFG